MLACATGQHIPKAVLIVRKAGKDQQEYLKVTLTDILVSNVIVNGDGHRSPLPTDEIKLNFAKIEYSYQPQGADGRAQGGPILAGWDVKANQKV